MKRKWDIASEDAKQKCVDEIITQIEELGATQVGMIAAQDIIDTVIKHLAPEVYNSGINDAKKLLEEKFRDSEVGLDLLKQ